MSIHGEKNCSLKNLAMETRLPVFSRKLAALGASTTQQPLDFLRLLNLGKKNSQAAEEMHTDHLLRTCICRTK